jgi:hypothetical protein
MQGQSGFFDVDERLKRLSDLGDQLLAFAAAVDFEMFRAELTRALAYSDGSQGGRPPFDPVLMFKVLVVQATNNLSDERAEFLINDRLSFMRFLDLGLADRVPDARTIPESYIVVRQVGRVPYGVQFENPGAVTALLSPDRPAALLENDGVLVAGRTVLEAYDRLEVLESTAEAIINCHALGTLAPKKYTIKLYFAERGERRRLSRHQLA